MVAPIAMFALTGGIIVLTLVLLGGNVYAAIRFAKAKVEAPKPGMAAWLVSILTLFCGPGAVLSALVGIPMGIVALRKAHGAPADAKIPAKVAIFNGCIMLVILGVGGGFAFLVSSQAP